MKKKIKLTVKKAANAKGYVVQYSTSKKFTKKTTKTINVAKTTVVLKKDVYKRQGYTLTTEDEASVVYGTEYTVKLELAAGYTKDSKPVVKANGVEVVVAEDGTYKIEIKEDTEITAEGVIEDIPETTKAPETTTAVPTTAVPTPVSYTHLDVYKRQELC